MKPKPKSVQTRLTVLQSLTLMTALWLLAGAGYIGIQIQSEMEEPLEELHRALATAAEMEIAVEELEEAVAVLHDTDGEKAREALFAAIDRLARLRRGYAQFHFTGEERRLAGQVLGDTGELVKLAQQALARPPQRTVQHQTLHLILTLHTKLKQNLHQIHELQLASARASYQRIRRYLVALIGLLAAAAIFAAAMLRIFRHMHRQHIWQPLEDLRQMVLQVRRGNLELHGRVPDTVELEPLFQSFIQMAAELRGMRQGLEQKVLERTAKLEEAQQQLLRAARLSALGQLVSGVAHEVNNPLTSILGFSEVALARADLDPRLRAHLETIRSESLRLRNVVANLTNYSRRGVPRMARIDLRNVLERLVELRRYQLRVSNIRLRYTPPVQPVWVRGDADQLLHVLFSLVLNAEQAIKSARAEGDIWLRCGVQAGQARVSVRDNGGGVPAGVREKIFEPFFTTKPMGQGTGMGLTVARDIVQQHRGEITVETEEGRGSTFTVVLPEEWWPESSADVAAAPETATDPATAPGANVGCVLVVDDEPAIVEMLEQLLAAEGWALRILSDTSSLEAAMSSTEFDLILCDLKMPGRDGLAILRWLREHRPELARRFVLMTGDLADADAHDEALAGVTILPKPFTLLRLREVLRQVPGAVGKQTTNTPSRR